MVEFVKQKDSKGAKKKRRMPPHLWKKGQSGNPNGRPKREQSIAELLRWAGELKAPEGLAEKMQDVFGLPPEEPLTVKQTIILASVMQAMKGDRAHLQFWAERTEGRMPETLNVSQSNKMVVVEEVVGVDGSDPEAVAAATAATDGPPGVVEETEEGTEE